MARQSARRSGNRKWRPRTENGSRWCLSPPLCLGHNRMTPQLVFWAIGSPYAGDSRVPAGNPVPARNPLLHGKRGPARGVTFRAAYTSGFTDYWCGWRVADAVWESIKGSSKNNRVIKGQSPRFNARVHVGMQYLRAPWIIFFWTCFCYLFNLFFPPSLCFYMFV